MPRNRRDANPDGRGQRPRRRAERIPESLPRPRQRGEQPRREQAGHRGPLAPGGLLAPPWTQGQLEGASSRCWGCGAGAEQGLGTPGSRATCSLGPQLSLPLRHGCSSCGSNLVKGPPPCQTLIPPLTPTRRQGQILAALLGTLQDLSPCRWRPCALRVLWAPSWLRPRGAGAGGCVWV